MHQDNTTTRLRILATLVPLRIYRHAIQPLNNSALSLQRTYIASFGKQT